MSKILLISHNDADGAGPAIILDRVFGEDLEVIHTTNMFMDEMIANSLEKANEYDKIFITDISCTDETANLIEKSKFVYKYVLLDHHKTALHLNKYSFANVVLKNPKDSWIAPYYTSFEDNGTASGSSLMLDYVYKHNLLENDENLNELIFHISAYDTWDWVLYFHLDKDCDTNQLNKLFYIIGLERFKESFKTKEQLFNETDKLLLEIEKEKIEAYCERKSKAFIFDENITINGKNYSLVYVTASQYLPDVFAKMQEMYDTDIYVIETDSSYSFRTLKSDIDVSNIANLFGGGGHPGAAGISIPIESKYDIFKNFIMTKSKNI